jgi:hypothetical protein
MSLVEIKQNLWDIIVIAFQLGLITFILFFFLCAIRELINPRSPEQKKKDDEMAIEEAERILKKFQS